MFIIIHLLLRRLAGFTIHYTDLIVGGHLKKKEIFAFVYIPHNCSLNRAGKGGRAGKGRWERERVREGGVVGGRAGKGGRGSGRESGEGGRAGKGGRDDGRESGEGRAGKGSLYSPPVHQALPVDHAFSRH